MENQPDRGKETRTVKRSEESVNESAVPLDTDELAPHVKIVRPTRPALVYDRME